MICGIAASLLCWQPANFTAFLTWVKGDRDGLPAPVLRHDHVKRNYTSHGPESADIGICLAFAAIPPIGEHPGGLGVLAELDPIHAPGILAAMRGLGQWGAMSIGAAHDQRTGDVYPAEVSLVTRGQQADEGALVIDYGATALRTWEFLTELAAGT